MPDTPPSEAIDLNARIAGRVRGLRATAGLTLDQLAAKSGVSRAMISLVERGETSATAVVLERLAAGFGVSLASLFEDPGAAPSPVVRASERIPWRDPETGYVRRNVSPPNFPSPLQIVDVALPAGARVAYESGPRPGSIHQQIWVQAGTLEVTVDGAKHRLERDDCLAMRLDGPTTFHNPTRKTTHYVVVLAADVPRPPRSPA